MNTTPFWKKPWVIVVAIVLVITAFGISTYNGFVTRSAAVDTQWAQVETQYQRRIDLIPNLVATTKGIADHETEVFTALADARSRYAGATTPDQKAEAASQTESALARLLVITENYPELRSSESFQTLMTQLEGTENRISVERARYNEAVQVYNVSLQRFPGSLFGKIFGFSTHAFFQAANGADKAPTVSF
jgi:LemA protein